MWKKSIYALILGSTFLVGCNTQDENSVNEESSVNNENANEILEDVNEGVDGTLESDSYNDNANGNDINNGTDGKGGKGEDAYNDATRGADGQDFNSENGTDSSERKDIENDKEADQNNRE
ncbi:hypothetical protein [Lysinibacillus telephonicus]|uniref:Uncharacterized protein n=1 Tax=Lysinibacillus telephonicus TaxID=1714840 RepID=A0A431URZ2_9BACI|nr:hypothetical protein [Lysinibacillus telephonicus]RTQ93124.1 hypothetical protein EKG35_09915 [Lysinibacillus telephonicus]